MEEKNARLALAVDLHHLVDGVDEHQGNEDECDLEAILDLRGRANKIKRNCRRQVAKRKRTLAMMSVRGGPLA